MRHLDFVRTPGGNKDWCELFPEPWSGNPYVVLVMAPQDAGVAQREVDGNSFGILKLPNGIVRGLQVLKPELKKWPQHEELFRAYGLRMPDPDYIGPFADIPSELLMRDQFPLIFLRDKFYEPFMPLRAVVKANTEPNDSDRIN